MLRRTASLFLVMILCSGSLCLPAANAKTKNAARVQDSPLVLNQTSVSQPGGTSSYTLTGHYTSGSRTVNLRSFTTKVARTSIQPPPGQPSNQPPYDPGGDYYQTESEMSRSDGTRLVLIFRRRSPDLFRIAMLKN
jgi:hypothetical protein